MVTLEVAPVLKDLSSRADALLDLSGRWIGVAIFDQTFTAMDRLGMSSCFPQCSCIAISVSSSTMSYMSGFSRHPEDKEWVNIMLLQQNEKSYLRLGVGRVSKYGWDNWAEPEVKDILLC
jgi:hypothetical protein